MTLQEIAAALKHTGREPVAVLLRSGQTICHGHNTNGGHLERLTLNSDVKDGQGLVRVSTISGNVWIVGCSDIIALEF
jgi:hypothetical protein